MEHKTENLMVTQLLKVVVDTSPTVVHECPYTVDIEEFLNIYFNKISKFQEFSIKNCSVVTKSLMSIFPSGEYKMDFFITNKKGQEIFNFIIVGTLVSPLKETFG